jgi:hypothetical protein
LAYALAFRFLGNVVTFFAKVRKFDRVSLALAFNDWPTWPAMEFVAFEKSLDLARRHSWCPFASIRFFELQRERAVRSKAHWTVSLAK